MSKNVSHIQDYTEQVWLCGCPLGQIINHVTVFVFIFINVSPTKNINKPALQHEAAVASLASQRTIPAMLTTFLKSTKSIKCLPACLIATAICFSVFCYFTIYFLSCFRTGLSDEIIGEDWASTYPAERHCSTSKY